MSVYFQYCSVMIFRAILLKQDELAGLLRVVAMALGGSAENALELRCYARVIWRANFVWAGEFVSFRAYFSIFIEPR